MAPYPTSRIKKTTLALVNNKRLYNKKKTTYFYTILIFFERGKLKNMNSSP